MKKYERGDKLRVRTDLVVGKRYGNDVMFHYSMEKLKGQIITVLWAGNTLFTIEGSENNWSPDMVEENKVSKYRVELL